MTRQQDQTLLLEGLKRMGSHGRAEAEPPESFIRTFWPIPAHLRSFDPDVVLVVGPRGSGKTELFRSVITGDLLPMLGDRAPNLRLPPAAKVTWLAAYPLATKFPDGDVLIPFLAAQERPEEAVHDLWLAYLTRQLGGHLQRSDLQELFDATAADPQEVLGIFRRLKKQALLALDALDERLEREDRLIFVAYDELDTLTRNDPDQIRKMVQGLVALWSARARRWRRLRAKIFLRTDLYDAAGAEAGADFAKLAAGRTELTWSDRDLYAMLIRRIVNQGDEAGELLRTYCRTAKINLQEHHALGWLPVIERAADAHPVVERMVGTHMGANSRKGLTSRWLLDHIRDGRGQALPRPLVRLIESAAAKQLHAQTTPSWPKLLEPKYLRRALDEVSREHVKACLDEWPWLSGIQEALAEQEVPWTRREVEKLLVTSLNHWPERAPRPPTRDARALIDYLVEIGAFRERSDGRLDVSDLYLAGLNLKRKGGVGRR